MPSGGRARSSRRRDATIVESAGLTYVEGPYIADTVRRLDIHK